MNPARIEYEHAADAALWALPSAERESIEAALRRLAEAPSPSEAPDVRRLGEGWDRYALRASDLFRVVFTLEPDSTILVRDIVNDAFVRSYFDSAAE